MISRAHQFDIFETIRKKLGNDYSLHGELTSPFDYFLDLVGYQDGLMAMITSPKKTKEILSHYSSLVATLASDMCHHGVDAIKISSPFAGAGFISPEFYAEFVVPYERKIVQEIRAHGVHAYTHTCGAIADRLELMFDSGVSGIECLDPPPLGNVELDEAFKTIGNRGFIKGNIDSVNTLLSGSKDQILEDARQRIEIGKRHGGFILSTACSIAPGVRRENILLLREAVERWG
jgi:MtaA/CmuA family methyltransferase